MPPLDLTSDFAPGDVVVEELPKSIQRLAAAIVADWFKHQGTFKSRGWVMDKDGHKRTKQLELEGGYGCVPRLQTLKTPGGEVQIWADSYYRMKIVDLIASVTSGASSSKTQPRRKRSPRPPRPRTQAELDALARGRETMRQRREAEPAS
jgi:hypothetical protein